MQKDKQMFLANLAMLGSTTQEMSAKTQELQRVIAEVARTRAEVGQLRADLERMATRMGLALVPTKLRD